MMLVLRDMYSSVRSPSLLYLGVILYESLYRDTMDIRMLPLENSSRALDSISVVSASHSVNDCEL